MRARTSIIVPTFANDEAVRRVTRLVKENTPSSYELIVVDNGSSARGYVATCNQGMAAGRGDVLVLMNDDCQPQPGWLGPLVDAVRRGIWLCSPDWPSARLAGHCLVLSREAYEYTAGLDERYVHTNADHHLEMTLARASVPICQVPESHVLHLAEDPLRIHYRKSCFLGNHEQLPNTGQMYLDDQATFESIWGDDRPRNYWPGDSMESWATDYVWSAA